MNIECKELLRQISEVSFAMDDINLYLDSHPCDKEALNYYHYVVGLRNSAMAAYEAQCGPLIVDQIKSTDYWTWVNDKWPWEGGSN